MSNSGKINIFMLICLGVLLYILLADKCSPNKPQPVVIKGETVEKLIDLTAQQKQAIDDSFNIILNKAYNDNDKNYTAYIKLLNENAELLMITKLYETDYPDTCKPIIDAWVKRETQLKSISDRKDAAAKVTITGLQGTVSEQKRFLASKDTMFNRLKIITDTCAKALVAMEKYVKQVAPKRKILVSVSGMGMYSGNLNPAVGGGLAYQNKKGLLIDANVYTNKIVTVSLKFPLIKF